eukprot:1180746-Prorocentrum_minimum.AAC.2
MYISASSAVDGAISGAPLRPPASHPPGSADTWRRRQVAKRVSVRSHARRSARPPRSWSCGRDVQSALGLGTGIQLLTRTFTEFNCPPIFSRRPKKCKRRKLSVKPLTSTIEPLTSTVEPLTSTVKRAPKTKAARQALNQPFHH